MVIALLFAFVLFSATFASAHEGGITGWFSKIFVRDTPTTSSDSFKLVELSPESLKNAEVAGFGGSVKGNLESSGGENLDDSIGIDGDLPGDEPSCVDECDGWGNLICVDGNVSDCGDYNGDGCLELHHNETCSNGCSAGQCIIESENLPDLYASELNWKINKSVLNNSNGSVYSYYVDVSWEIKNLGQGYGTFPLYVSVYSSVTNSWRTVWAGLQNGGLAHGQSASFNNQFVLRDGDKNLKLGIDPDNLVFESNENNNVLIVGLTHTTCVDTGVSNKCAVGAGLGQFECISNSQCQPKRDLTNNPPRNDFMKKFTDFLLGRG